MDKIDSTISVANFMPPANDVSMCKCLVNTKIAFSLYLCSFYTCNYRLSLSLFLISLIVLTTLNISLILSCQSGASFGIFMHIWQLCTQKGMVLNPLTPTFCGNQVFTKANLSPKYVQKCPKNCRV